MRNVTVGSPGVVALWGEREDDWTHIYSRDSGVEIQK